MKKKHLFIVALVIFLLIIISNTLFIVREDESAIVMRFGEIIGIYVKENTHRLHSEVAEDADLHGLSVKIHEGTGLRVKIPFIESVVKYSTRTRTDDSPEQPIITNDRKTLIFDNNAQWRVTNPMRFYMVVQNYNRASSLIDERLYALMRIEVGNIEAHDLVTNRIMTTEMLERLTEQVNREVRRFGVDIVGINIKRTEVPLENHQAIHNRMNSERNRIAAQYRSEGQEEYLRISSATDREVVEITSEAFRRAEELRGDGDSEAARIYNDAYGQDPEFFEFYNLLITYGATLGNRTTLVIPLDSPFAKYLVGVDMSVADDTPVIIDPPPDDNGNGDGDND
ncbi:MAG: protease modulator HflC [Oscillospiraceae bacterium]|jgi:membrane protease subunit HflC|nr:protease modulator HflC [Oscillospiraceae bacterium]